MNLLCDVVFDVVPKSSCSPKTEWLFSVFYAISLFPPSPRVRKRNGRIIFLFLCFFHIFNLIFLGGCRCWRVRWPKKGKSDNCKDANEVRYQYASTSSPLPAPFLSPNSPKNKTPKFCNLSLDNSCLDSLNNVK